MNFKFSYLEIYNENIRDLMVNKSENLMVIEDANKGVFVPDLTDYALEAADDIKKFITNGNTRRVMASTAANTFSSRYNNQQVIPVLTSALCSYFPLPFLYFFFTLDLMQLFRFFASKSTTARI